MPVLTAPTFVFAVGDTLRMPVTYRNPPAADGTPGAPIDLTGKMESGLFYTAKLPPIALSVGDGLALTPLTGLMDFVINNVTCATLTPDRDPPSFLLAEGYSYAAGGRSCGRLVRFPNRLRVRVRDPESDDIGTITIFAVRLYDPATVDLTSLPVAQAGTVIATS